MRSSAVVARNLPEHARNAIHTDAGARAQGFPRALVAGVTTYAYLVHPAIDQPDPGLLDMRDQHQSRNRLKRR